MNVVAYGAGTDSTAMLIECHKRGIDIDLILFADTGGERPETYKYLKMFSEWLVCHHMPAVITVRSHLPTLHDDCINNKCLPSIAYGFKSCSDKWKIRPVNKYLRENYRDKEIIKFIGIDSSEDHRAIESHQKWCKNRFPLVEWDIDRYQCIKIIKDAGLCLPGKSSCYFCPSAKPHEIRNLMLQHPDLAAKAMDMESNADLKTIKGLGRNYSWTNLLATDDMFDDDLNTIDIACGCYDG